MIVVSSKIASVLRATVSLILLFCQNNAMHAAIGKPTVVISVVIACISMNRHPLIKWEISVCGDCRAARLLGAVCASDFPLHYNIKFN